MNGKHPLKSKTIWFNILYVLAYIIMRILAQYGYGVDTAEIDKYFIALAPVMNMILRAVTHEPLRLK